MKDIYLMIMKDMLVESDDPDVRTYLSQNIEEILIDNENIKITLVEH